MSESLQEHTILYDVKAYVGLNPSEVDEDFDPIIVKKINKAIAKIAQLGVRNLGEFSVTTGNETWDDFLGDEFQYLRAFAIDYIECVTKMSFDPPQSGSLYSALEEEIRQATFDVQTAIESHE